MAKRTVKLFTIYDSVLKDISLDDLNRTREGVGRPYDDKEWVVPVTITYDDAPKPKPRRKRKGGAK